MLFALLSDIELVGTLEKQKDHFVSIYIDETEVVVSEKKDGVPPLLWETKHSIQFRPSSKMSIKLFRNSINPLRLSRSHQIGQHTRNIIQLFENNSELELIDGSSGSPISARLTIKLTIINDLANDIVKRVDADFAAADLNHAKLTMTSTQIDDAMSISRVRRADVKGLGYCAEPLGNALKLLVKVVDSVSDAHSVAKASCTVLAAAYRVIQEQTVQDENVVSLAESLRVMLSVFRTIPDLTVVEGTSDVIDEIGRVSLEVASLIDESAKLPSIVKFQITDDLKTRIDNCKQNCVDLTEKLRTKLGIDVSKGVKTIKDNILTKEIFKLLNAPDNSRNYNDACKKHQIGTSSWFINSEKFSNWKKSDKFLCIFGKAGCGKTVLCSSIITNVMDMCMEKESSAFAYFFFDGRNGQKELQLLDGLIRSLIQQFVHQCDSVPSLWAELYEKLHRRASTDTLGDILLHILRGFTHAYIVIDSLDECAERQELLKWVKNIAFSNASNLHILVTSRPEEEIKDAILSFEPPTIYMDEDSENHDIHVYMDYIIKEGRLKRWPETVQSQIRNTLVERAQGMFRWFAMQIEEVDNCLDEGELDEQLERLPQDLDETYCRILAKIPEQRRTRVKVFLLWTAFSTRPPTLEELVEAGAMEFDQENVPRYNPRRKFGTRDVLTACGSLIVESNGRVQLAHFSVKEFLVSDRIANAAGDFGINELLSHSFMAKASLAYLLRLDSSEPPKDEDLAAYPLAEYAANNSVFHVRSGGGDGDHVVTKLIVTLLESDNPLLNWIRLRDPENLRRGVQRHILSTEIAEPLYYASLLDFTTVSQHLLYNGANPYPQRTGGDRTQEKSVYMRYGNALQAACYEGHVEMVKILFDYGADVNMLGGKFGSALQAAAWICDEAMVKLLLEHGADVNIPGGEYGCALQAAACRGHKTIVWLLLENGADVDLRGGKYDTALQAAMLNGHDDVTDLLMERGTAQTSMADIASFIQAVASGDHETVKSLLEKGVDVNMSGGAVGSPLLRASLHGHTEVVRLLLANNADVNRQTGIFGSPLQAASVGGHKEIVELLLANGADVNAQGGMYGNALMAAVIQGHDYVVQQLLDPEYHADVNARSSLQLGLFINADPMTLSIRFHEKEADMDAEEESSYALHWASYRGHISIVKILLDHGADVNAQGGLHGNALRAALDYGHENIAILLLKRGATPPADLQQNNDS